MSTYSKSEVMSRAWRIIRRFPNMNWSDCLKRSWAIEKEKESAVSPAILNKILNNLRTVNRSRSLTESKPIMAGTQEHFKILNSRLGRRTMKLPESDESKQMLTNGVLVMNDIIQQRRRESITFSAPVKKSKTTFRNRIINLDNCVKIDINEYI